jgi:hypothetical protein
MTGTSKAALFLREVFNGERAPGRRLRYDPSWLQALRSKKFAKSRGQIHGGVMQTNPNKTPVPPETIKRILRRSPLTPSYVDDDGRLHVFFLDMELVEERRG